MRQAQHRLQVETPRRGLFEITRPVAAWLASTGLRDGLLTAFIRHTSARLLIQENADPEVRRDLERFLARLVPMVIRCSSTRRKGATTCLRTCAPH